MVARGVAPRIEPEFGPAPYMPLDPATGKAAADLWEVNSWIAERQKERWLTR
jgi:hypothetical protein